MQNILDNLRKVHDQITSSCELANRNAEEVRLLCVSKTKPEQMIIEAYAAGERCFGESYAVEAAQKIESLKAQGYNDIIWHFIGPIQSNKTKHIAAHFDVVESLDRIKIAQRLNDQRPEGLKPLKVMIQVNISHEDQKQGCDENELEELLKACSVLPKLEVIGLMGVARIDANKQELEQSFGSLKALRDRLSDAYPQLKELSMGMTHDLSEAIASGSTEVRIGSAIFGEREYHH